MNRKTNNFEKKIIPHKLRSARLARGMTITELADQVGVSRQTINAYELGQNSPRGENLIKLVEVLQFPISFFYDEYHNQSPTGSAFFRSLKSSTQKIRSAQLIYADFFEEIRMYLGEYIALPPLNIPTPLGKALDEITEEDIENLASEVRELWGLSDSPINNLTKTIEKNGIMITSLDFGEKSLDAFSQWRGNTPYIVLGNPSESNARRRFSIAHELGHILLHTSVDDIHQLDKKMFANLLESQANYFAACLLLPEESFIDSLVSISIDYFIELKKTWGVSIAAILHRACSLGLVTDNQNLYLNKLISKRRWRTSEPLDDIIPTEKPIVLKTAFNMVVDNNLRKHIDIFHDLNIPQDEICKICQIENITFDSPSPTPVLRVIKNS